jgi:hypothetical protein
VELVVAPLGRPIAFAAAAGAAVLLAFPLGAAAREREHPSASAAAPDAAAVADYRGIVVKRAAPVVRAARVPAAASSYSTKDGYRILVEASPAYPADPAADQKLVDFLGTRLHGPELGRLAVYVGKPAEIRSLCGGVAGVVACYAIEESRMYVPGEAVGDIPVEYPLTHEYGHHVAGWRSNHPWDAVDWGPKYWSSETRVCTYVTEGLLFPGDQGLHYLDDPGEGFADGYAHLHYPDRAWDFNELLRPDASTFAAIRRDVLRPWTGARTRTFRGRLSPRRDSRSFKLRLRLDGEVRLRVSGPRGASYSVEAEGAGFASGRTLRAGGGYRIEWCRRQRVEHVTLTVRRRSGAGRFALNVRWPG